MKLQPAVPGSHHPLSGYQQKGEDLICRNNTEGETKNMKKGISLLLVLLLILSMLPVLFSVRQRGRSLRG